MLYFVVLVGVLVTIGPAASDYGDYVGGRRSHGDGDIREATVGQGPSGVTALKSSGPRMKAGGRSPERENGRSQDEPDGRVVSGGQGPSGVTSLKSSGPRIKAGGRSPEGENGQALDQRGVRVASVLPQRIPDSVGRATVAKVDDFLQSASAQRWFWSTEGNHRPRFRPVAETSSWIPPPWNPSGTRGNVGVARQGEHA